MTDDQEHRVGAFYDGLSDDYDRMTAFEKRLVTERPFFRLLAERYSIKSAVDAGSGTGLHSVLLAELGVRVTAVDVSARMLESVRAHAAERKVAVATLHSAFRELPERLPGTVDAVFSLGNTLAHLLEQADLDEALGAFRRILAPEGVLVIGMLNYDRILESREQVQAVRESDGVRYVRTYEYDEDRLVFSVVKTLEPPGELEQQRSSVPLRPWRCNDLVRSITASGFGGVETSGSISLEPFKPRSSKDLVIIARLGASSQPLVAARSCLAREA